MSPDARQVMVVIESATDTSYGKPSDRVIVTFKQLSSACWSLEVGLQTRQLESARGQRQSDFESVPVYSGRQWEYRDRN